MYQDWGKNFSVTVTVLAPWLRRSGGMLHAAFYRYAFTGTYVGLIQPSVDCMSRNTAADTVK
jgi:hypothetical protein